MIYSSFLQTLSNWLVRFVLFQADAETLRDELEFKNHKIKEYESMLQAERQRLKDMGQELQVNRKVARVGRDSQTKNSISYFRVAFCLCFKTSPGAQFFIWKWVSLARSLSCKPNSFPYERLCTRTRFETEAKRQLGNGLFVFLSFHEPRQKKKPVLHLGSNNLIELPGWYQKLVVDLILIDSRKYYHCWSCSVPTLASSFAFRLLSDEGVCRY